MMKEDHLLNLINDPTWDSPFFKRLANNDTGNARGHQGGIVVPKDLRQFFPELDEGRTSSDTPIIPVRPSKQTVYARLLMSKCKS